MQKASSPRMSRATTEQGRGYFPVQDIRSNFFSIIHTNIIEEKKLCLPRWFVKKHRNDLPAVVTLKVPTGGAWSVEVRKACGKIWLGSGFKDFVDHHAIDVGHALFFSYEGHSTFNVTACDMTGAEIGYPCKKDITKMPLKHAQEIGNQHKQKPNVGQGEPSKTEGAIMTPYWSPRQFSSKGSRIQENPATQAGRRHKSMHPSFLIVMQPSYVQDKYALNVPVKFMKKYIGSGSRDIFLRVSNGASHVRVWTAHCRFYDRGVVKIYGWKAFAEDNGLRLHDVCVFELTNLKNADFMVSIYRNKKNVPHKMLNLSNPRNSRAWKPGTRMEETTTGEAFSFKSGYPFFIVRLDHTNVTTQFLYLPTNFVMKHLPKESTHARITDSNGSVWYMDYNFAGSKAWFGDGWDALVQGYNLKEGYVCAFELIAEQGIQLKISTLFA